MSDIEKIILGYGALSAVSVFWMQVKTTKYKTKDKKKWMILAFILSFIAVVAFMFTEGLNKKQV